MLRPPANDRQPLARLHEGQAVVTGDNDGLLALGAAVERGHGVARVCPEEHAAHRAVEARRLTHRHLPYSLHGEPGERAARVAQHEGARTGGSEHGDHHTVRVHVVRARLRYARCFLPITLREGYSQQEFFFDLCVQRARAPHAYFAAPVRGRRAA